jgi:putative drug exporter of the RND superfamily
VVVIGLVIWARSAGQDTNDNLTLPGTGSQAATDLLADKFPAQANGSIPIAVQAPVGQKLTKQSYRTAIGNTTKAYAKDPDVSEAISPFSDQADDQLDKSQRTGYIALYLSASPSDLSLDDADRLTALEDPLEAAGLKAAAGGYLGQKVSKPSTHLSEVVGLAAAVVILLLTFGTAVAMGVPIATAVLGLATGMGVITLLSHVMEVPTSGPALATMIGLGVGIDYALFVVSRHRRQLQDGMDPIESVARATATSGGAVVFAGGTVTIALLSLWAAGIPLVTTLGLTAAVVVIVAVTAAITLLPAILALLGPRINRLRLPGLETEHDDRPHGWARWANFVAGHPWPALIGGLAFLVVLAIPVFSLELGQQDNGELPTDTEARRSFDLMSEGFGAGSNGPILIAVNLTKPAANDQQQLQKTKQQLAEVEAEPQTQQTQSQEAQLQQQEQFYASPASDPRLTSLRKQIEQTKRVASVTLPLVNKGGSAAVMTVTPTTSPSNLDTNDLVNTLRDDVIPPATAGKQMSADVGGTTAGYIDLATEIGDKLPLVIALVLGLTFVVLLLAFRSLLVPLKAVVMNVFSILAAFGIVSYAFSHHWSATLVGLDGTIPIVSYVPLMMFAILFGLSMDYEVFLMSHVRESWKQTSDPHEAVVHGLATTARVITSAALIMVSVFAAFVFNGDPTVKQFGLGMAAAVAVDATIVRCLLVPAIMSLLGRAGWWMPNWLHRTTPELSIEGEEWFARRDAAAARERGGPRGAA